MKTFLNKTGLQKFWSFVKTYIDKKFAILRNELKNSIPILPSGLSDFKFFKLSNGNGDTYLPLTFSQSPGSEDMFFVFGRSNAQGGYNNSDTVCFGIITFEDAYDNVSKGTPVWYGISHGTGSFSWSDGQMTTQRGYASLAFGKSYPRIGLGTFTVQRYSSVGASPAVYRIVSGPYARLWCITNSKKVII